MSRRGGSSSANGIQLLPFLDILTCTMGALVTLLFAFARYGQQQVVNVSDAKQVAAEAAAADEIEDLEWRASMLRESRAKTEADLGNARLELSHLEDHMRRLRQRAEQLHQAAIALDQADPRASEAKTAAEVAKIKERISLTAQELELARKNASERPTTYSIVPYAGPNQTRRRPIYIECRAEGVVLEPEGIVFTDADFAGPLGPGNPLAVAVRAACEYMSVNDPDAFDKVEPYPLLVVRPDAIEQYYAARSALISFGSQFGYELIGADKKLKFPDADPRMGEFINNLVAEARVRQAALIAAAPSATNPNRVSTSNPAAVASSANPNLAPPKTIEIPTVESHAADRPAERVAGATAMARGAMVLAGTAREPMAPAPTAWLAPPQAPQRGRLPAPPPVPVNSTPVVERADPEGPEMAATILWASAM